MIGRLRGPAGTAKRSSERLRESGLQEFAQLRSGPELWDGFEFLECGGEHVRETPDCARCKLLVLGLEVKIMHRAGKMFGGFQPALDESFVDDHLRRDIRQFTSLPGLHLFSHRFEVPLHPVNTDRDAIDERERLRVLGEHRRERA
jgi:hypothetical protein